MKSKLIILSDLWGKRKRDWWRFYIDALNPFFEVVFYDCTELAAIEANVIDEKAIHTQFINGGIEKAVQKLIEIEKEPVTILAFSIGGVIAWKYALITSNTKFLYAVSSNRLRKESEKPNSEIELWFGENDDFTPKDKWFNDLKISPHILESMGHNMYSNSKFSKELCDFIIEKGVFYGLCFKTINK